MFTHYTLKIAGFHLRLRHFYREIHYGERLKTTNYSDEENSEKHSPLIKTKEELEKQSYKRAQEKVTDLINANITVGLYGPESLTAKFFTQTYKDNVQSSDTPRAIKDFTAYIKKVNWNYFGKQKTSGFLKYVAVMELQPKSQKIHFHTALFNQPWIEQRKLQDLWGHGIVHIKKIKDVNYGWYMSKYLGKNFREYHAAGKKHYFRSKGLFEPLVLKDEDLILSLRNLIPESAVSHSIKGVRYLIWNGKQFLEQVEDREEFTLENFPEILKMIQEKIKLKNQREKRLYYQHPESSDDLPEDYNLPF